jgi:hypothetical protein
MDGNGRHRRIEKDKACKAAVSKLFPGVKNIKKETAKTAL